MKREKQEKKRKRMKQTKQTNKKDKCSLLPVNALNIYHHTHEIICSEEPGFGFNLHWWYNSLLLLQCEPPFFVAPWCQTFQTEIFFKVNPSSTATDFSVR